jgi:hypothetical protein
MLLLEGYISNFTCARYYRVILNDCDFFLKLGTFFINYFGKLDILRTVIDCTFLNSSSKTYSSEKY